MSTRRQERLGSLLQEVITEVISKDVRNPHIAELWSISYVDVSKDVHYAKVYVSVIADDDKRKQTIEALQTAAGFIAVNASKKVSLRYFPELTFKLDTSVDKQLHVEKLLQEIHEKDGRPTSSEQTEG